MIRQWKNGKKKYVGKTKEERWKEEWMTKNNDRKNKEE